MILPLIVAAFALPMASVQGVLVHPSGSADFQSGMGILSVTQAWIPLFPGLAVLAGMALGLMVWAPDHAGRHVYALSLPLSRRSYVLMKLGAGALMTLPMATAMGVAAILATSFIPLPAGLSAYPMALATRFLVASIVAYALTFALAAWSGRRAVAAVAVAAGLLILAEVAVNVTVPMLTGDSAAFSPVAWVFERMLHAPGPLHVFTGNWAMIDV